MAASVPEATFFDAKSECFLCQKHERYYYRVTGRKGDEVKLFLSIYFPGYSAAVDDAICRACYNKMDNFRQFQSKIQQNLKERCQHLHASSELVSKHGLTPGKIQTPKRRRTVVESLMSSIEKLKVTDSCSADQNSRDKESQLRTKKQLFEKDDHSYSAKPAVVRQHVNTKQKGSVSTDQWKKVIEQTQAAVKVLSGGNTSVLTVKSPQCLMEENLFSQAVDELELNVPFLYELLDNIVGETGQKRATIGLIYSMILNSRNRRVSAIQKMMTTLAIKCHADNKLLSRLNNLHLTMSAESKKSMIKSFSDCSEQKVIEVVHCGQDGKLNGDNVDIHVTTNDIRMTNKSKDYHFFASDWTPFRIKEGDFASNEWLKETTDSETRPASINIHAFEADLSKFRANIKTLVARLLIEHFGQTFKWMDLVVPEHIDHPLQEIMSSQTESYCLPILLKNEAKYEDCIGIMDCYEDLLSGWYRKAGRGDDFEKLLIPVGGDQLTRVRLDGAKTLRMGAHTSQERFDNLNPIVVEMFHTQMDFLEKTVKKFMKQTGRDVGTLTNLKIQIQRSSVNGNVKSRFKAREDFVMLCGKGYVLEAAMDYFGMDNAESPVKKKCPPENIEKSHQPRRLSVFHDIMDGLVDTLVGPLSFNETTDTATVSVNGQVVKLPVVEGKITIKLQTDRLIQVQVPMNVLEQKQVMQLQLPNNINVNMSLLKDDELRNYSSNFLQYYFIMLNMKDAVKEGDICRTSNMLKIMIPFFYKHSHLSKYMVECIDFILKTELVLPTKLSLQVRALSFVNPSGRKGKNKACDMAKENQVREVKDLIRGLGANKTEESIVKISKACPVIKKVVSNVDYQIGYREVKSSHKRRSEQDDLTVILDTLRRLRPFQTVPGRSLRGYPNMKSSVFYELKTMQDSVKDKILSTATRLNRGFNFSEDEDIE